MLVVSPAGVMSLLQLVQTKGSFGTDCDKSGPPAKSVVKLGDGLGRNSQDCS